MNDIVARLKLQSSEFDSKVKRAAQGIQRMAEECHKAGGVLNALEDENKKYVQSIGRMETVSKTARGSLAELTAGFMDMKHVYNQLSQEEKNSEFGRELNKQIGILKQRVLDTKQELKSMEGELSGSKFGQFGGLIDDIGKKFGINANLTELLTSRTALMTAGIGASIAVITKATEAWAGYNKELAKQDQQTKVVTGLDDAGAKKMTDSIRAMVDTYNVDFRQAVEAANTLMSQFGESGEKATQLLRDGLRGMLQGDGPKLLQMIQQYAPAFRDAGVSARQLVAVIQNSEGGIFTAENMNAIVMGIKNIRLMTKQTSEALAQLGIDGQQMSRQMNDGSMTVFDALKQVASKLKDCEAGSQTAGEVMQRVFGKQGAMAGQNLAKAIEGLNLNLEETKRQTGELGDAYADLQKANENLNKAIRDCFEYDGWEQMATGIQSKLVGALAAVLQKIGDIKGALGGFSVTQQQGDTKNGGGAFMDRALDRLKGGWSQGRQNIFDRQIQAYSSKILDINDQIRDIQEKAAADMDGNMSVVYEKQIRNLENRKEAIKRNMDEYDRRGQAILKETPTAPTSIPVSYSTKGGNKGVGTTKTEQTEMQTLQKQIQELEQEYIKLGNITTEDANKRRSDIQSEIAANEKRINQIKLLGEQAHGRLLGGNVTTDNLGLARFAETQKPKDFNETMKGFTTMKQQVQMELTADNMKVDEATLKTFLQDSVQNGIDGMDLQFNAISSKLAEGIDVPDTAWQNILDQYNQMREQMGQDPIIINFKTGKMEGVISDVDKLKKTISTTASVVGTIGQAFNAIEDPAGKVAAVVAQAIANVALAYSDALAKTTAEKFNIWSFIAASASAMISMGTTIASIHSATGYAQGGMIKSNSYSGDNVGGLVDGSQLVGLNAGELVLTKAQQGNLAQALQSDGSGGGYTPSHVSGEQIWIALNAFTRRTGRGELVTWR